MYQAIKAAIIVHLAEYHGLSADLKDYLEYLAMAAPEQMNDYIETRIMRSNDAALRQCLRELKLSLIQLKRDMQSDDDYATMLANYETLTGKRFEIPAWFSGEMEQVAV